MTGRGVLVAGLGATAVALATAVSLQAARDAAYPRGGIPDPSLLYVRSGPVMQRLALSFDALAADVYWIRALQHYGGDKLDASTSRQKYQLLYPLLDLTTSLDPYFTIAYRFGAIFLSEPPPNGPGRPEQAVELLQKGLAVQPTKWQYHHDIGFVYYWTLRDTASAAQWFRRAAGQPGAPNWLETLTAAILIEGGDRGAARVLLREILSAEEEWMRRMARRGLNQLDALDVIDRLQPLIRRATWPAGEPYSWEGLVRRGVLPGIPTDPTGVPYDIDPATGTIVVSRASELFPMPGFQARPR